MHRKEVLTIGSRLRKSLLLLGAAPKIYRTFPVMSARWQSVVDSWLGKVACQAHW